MQGLTRYSPRISPIKAADSPAEPRKSSERQIIPLKQKAPHSACEGLHKKKKGKHNEPKNPLRKIKERDFPHNSAACRYAAALFPEIDTYIVCGKICHEPSLL